MRSDEQIIFENVFATLCCSQNDPGVARIFDSLGSGARRVVQHLVYMDFFDRGISFLFDEKLYVSSVFFFSEGRHKSHHGYTGSFPGSLRFGASRKEVRNNFDQPLASSEGGDTMYGIPNEPWDKFAYKGHTIHVEYSGKNQTAAMVTIACGEGQVELPLPESANSLGLMNILRQWFKPKNPMGIKSNKK